MVFFAPHTISHLWFKGQIEFISTLHPTAESDSAVCIIPRSQTPRCASYRGVGLRGVHHTEESDSAVCITPRSHEIKVSEKTLWCASHSGVRLRGVHHTAESSSTVCITPRSQ